MHTFNSIDSVYFVYSLSDKTKRMAYKKATGINDTLEVKSNLLRHTDGRLYVATKSSLRAINPDETYTTMANIGSLNLGFITTPIVINPGWWLYLTRGSYCQHTGKKVYELKDHLGNVRAVITDRKFIKSKIDLMAELVTASDYYAFGAPLYGRKYVSQTGSYRFGFNGQEKVDEVSGEGNHNTAEYWEYDPRLGIRWNMDPITYPWQSPYVCLNDNPICFIDPLGLKGLTPGDDPPAEIHIDLNEFEVHADRIKKNWLQRAWTSLKKWVTSAFTINHGRYTDNKFTGHVLNTAAHRLNIENNPWRNRNNIHIPKAGFQTSTSPWMKDFNRAFGTTLNVGVMGPLAAEFAVPMILEASPQFTMKFAGYKFLASNLVQYTLNNQVDEFDATLDAFTVPGLSSSLIGGFVDARISSDGFTFSYFGNGKSLNSSLYDSGSRYVFGSFRNYGTKVTAPMLGNNVDRAFFGFTKYYLLPLTTGTVSKGLKMETKIE